MHEDIFIHFGGQAGDGVKKGDLGDKVGGYKKKQINGKAGENLVHSCTIFLCCLDDLYRNPNMNNKDHN